MARSLAVTVAIASAAAIGCFSTSQSNLAPALADETNLRGSCPNPVVVQAAWYPDITHSYYELLGDGYSVDPRQQRVTGPLVAPGPAGPVNTGIRIEIRSGGPAVSFAPTDDLMWRDRSITLGEQGTDEQILAASRGRAVLSVFAPLDLDPLVFMWDARKYPTFNTVSDIGQTNVRVLTIGDDPSTLYLLATGILRASQLAPGFDGSPKPWIDSGGKAVMGGYATKDPYVLSHTDPTERIRTALVAEAGYPNYRTTVTIRTEDRPKLDKCLQRLVPIMQRAHVAFMTNPERQIRLVVKLNSEYKTAYPYTESIARFGYEELRRQAIVFNGRDGKIGDFDLGPKGRIDRMINTLVPVYEGRNLHLPPLKPTDLATNDYLAPIGLPSDN